MRRVLSTIKDLHAAVNDGNLCVTDDIRCLMASDSDIVIRANAGDANAAMAFAATVSGRWRWTVGYDNRAVMKRRDYLDGGRNEISVISLSPAHALLMAALEAWME